MKRKRARRFTAFRLHGDGPGVVRRLRTTRRLVAIRYLDLAYGRGFYQLLP